MVPQNSIVRIRLASMADNQLGMNVLHYVVTSINNENTEINQDWADEVSDHFSAEYKGVLGALATYWGASIQMLHPTPTQPITSRLSQGAGLGLGDLLPKQTSGIISLKTNTGGRQGRGRVYIPFPSEDHSMATGEPNTPYMTALGLLAQKLLDPIVVTSGAIVAEMHIGVYGRLTQQVLPAIQGVTKQAWATQRRRSDFGAMNREPW